MTFGNILQLFLAAAPGAVVSIAMAIWSRRQSARDKAHDEAEKRAEKSQVLQISLLIASASLSYAVAMAIKRGKPNGEVEEGIKNYEKAMEKFRQYERELVAKGD